MYKVTHYVHDYSQNSRQSGMSKGIFHIRIHLIEKNVVVWKEYTMNDTIQ